MKRSSIGARVEVEQGVMVCPVDYQDWMVCLPRETIELGETLNPSAKAQVWPCQLSRLEAQHWRLLLMDSHHDCYRKPLLFCEKVSTQEINFLRMHSTYFL